MKTLQQIKEYLEARKANNQKNLDLLRFRETNRTDTKPWTLKGVEKDGWFSGRVDLIKSVLEWLDKDN